MTHIILKFDFMWISSSVLGKISIYIQAKLAQYLLPQGEGQDEGDEQYGLTLALSPRESEIYISIKLVI